MTSFFTVREMSTRNKEFSRLPKSVTPLNYDLHLKPSLKDFSFDGTVHITVKVSELSHDIVLNGIDIEVFSATFHQHDKTLLETSDVVLNESDERVIVKFRTPPSIGVGILSLCFRGKLNDKMKGFYRTKYTVDGESRYGAVTQFEAAYARMCFPCWDEPALKATFDVTLVVPKDRVSLSNMDIISESICTEDSNCKVLKYARTPVMSTYLLAFAIGEFEFVEGKTMRGLPVRVNTTRGDAYRGRYALDVAVRAMDYYEDYFAVSYPLPKLDLVAISDFGGAMENWGLITYQESALLIDAENSSAQTKQLVCLVVCHELAHQWFGNLVTMEWWTYLWLNEGFASFIAYLATDHCHPEFDVWTQFISTDYRRGINLDALDSSHPIESSIGKPDEIGEIFDAISYCKGASVLRMLHNWIGDECFRKAMHIYLKQHAYKNTITEDLWKCLEQASGKPVEKVMKSWVKQTGFPILHVMILLQDDKQCFLKLSQRRFTANKHNFTGDCTKWSIPVAISSDGSGGNSVVNILLEEESAEVIMDSSSCENWVKVNPGTYGFYRVSYDSNLLKGLLSAVKNKSLHPRDRLGVENDLFALATSGVTSTIEFLLALETYENETNYAVWSDLDSNIGSLSVLLWRDEVALEKFKDLILQLYGKVYEYLGFDPRQGESHQDSMLRSLIIHRLGRFGCKTVIKEAVKRLDNHISGATIIHADLRSAIYSTVLVNGAPDILTKIMNLYKSADMSEEKERIQRALGCVNDPTLIETVLNFSMTDNVRPRDKVFLIGSVATNSKLGRDMAWKYVTQNLDELTGMYKGSFSMARLIKMTTENFLTDKEADEISLFFEKNPVGVERSIKQSIENIRRKASWWKRDGGHISAWITSKGLK